MEMNKEEARYLVDTRSAVYVDKYGSIDKAIKILETENKSYEDMWSYYSCDSLGHGITCTYLMIGWLNKLKEETT